VVDALGFGVAAVNLVHEDGSFEVVAVAGSDEARRELMGQRNPASAFDHEFAQAEHWGSLRFVPHDRPPAEGMTGWVAPTAALPDAGDDGSWHPLDALYAPLVAPSGQLVGVLSVDLPHDGRLPGPLQRELLEMYAAQAGIAVDNARLSERLRTSEASFRLAFDHAGCGMTMTGLDPQDPGRLLRVNQALCDLLGYSCDELTGMTVADITHPDDLAPSLADLSAAAGGRMAPERAEKRYIRRDGSHVWVAITASVIRLDSGETLHSITQVEDITDRRATEFQLAWRANNDPLTGLLNRVGLHDALLTCLTGAADGERPGPERRTGSRPAPGTGVVMYGDLDSFKALNDTYGHAFGDRVLQVVAARLGEQVREQDTVGRIGGDEFAIVAPGVTLAEAAEIADRVEQAVASPFDVSGRSVAITISIGIAALDCARIAGRPPGEPDIDTLLHLADMAMYEAKAKGGNGHVLHQDAHAGALTYR
jgi:diguanylate cyclase (GGDEF)-like protein/PAS domain S-box-containing protein